MAASGFWGTPVFRYSKEIPELPEWGPGTSGIDFRSFRSFWNVAMH